MGHRPLEADAGVATSMSRGIASAPEETVVGETAEDSRRGETACRYIPVGWSMNSTLRPSFFPIISPTAFTPTVSVA